MRLRGTQHTESEEQPDGLHGRSRKRSPRADAGMARLVSMSVLTNMARAMKARGLRLDLLGDYDTALSCMAFHRNAANPYLKNGSDYESFLCLPLLPRSMSEEDFDRQNPRSEKVRQVCCRCRTSDDWGLQTARQPAGPLRRRHRHPTHRVPRPRRTKRWATAHADYDAALFNGATIWALP